MNNFVSLLSITRGGKGGSLDQHKIRGPEHLVEDCTCLNQMNSPLHEPSLMVRQAMSSLAGRPKGRAIAFGDFVKDGGEKKALGAEIAHGL